MRETEPRKPLSREFVAQVLHAMESERAFGCVRVNFHSGAIKSINKEVVIIDEQPQQKHR
jgi:hypothetical protein